MAGGALGALGIAKGSPWGQGSCGSYPSRRRAVSRSVRDDNARTLLFDLDQTIQQLSAERGIEDTACVRLTGIYHNLIRCWADA